MALDRASVDDQTEVDGAQAHQVFGSLIASEKECFKGKFTPESALWLTAGKQENST